MSDQNLENVNVVELIYKLLTEQGKNEGILETKLDQVLKNQDIMTERINKRESEYEQLRRDHNNDKEELKDANSKISERISKIETTIDILKFLIGAGLAIGGAALVEGIIDKM